MMFVVRAAGMKSEQSADTFVPQRKMDEKNKNPTLGAEMKLQQKLVQVRHQLRGSCQLSSEEIQEVHQINLRVFS